MRGVSGNLDDQMNPKIGAKQHILLDASSGRWIINPFTNLLAWSWQEGPVTEIRRFEV